MGKEPGFINRSTFGLKLAKEPRQSEAVRIEDMRAETDVKSFANVFEMRTLLATSIVFVALIMWGSSIPVEILVVGGVAIVLGAVADLRRRKIVAKGLNIGTNYYNRLAALDDFNALNRFAISVDRRALAEQHIPPVTAGWRTIDKHLARLREALRKEGFEPPSNPSSL